MKLRLFAAILLSALSFTSVVSQNINTQKLDSLFNILAEKNKAMGSVAVSKNGTVQYTRAIGYSFISHNDKKPATTATKYRIGSISKMFTSTIIFQLIEEGKVNLTTTLDTYFPEIPNASKITIGNMLSHRSGIHNFTDEPEYRTYMTQPRTENEMVKIISKNKSDFEADAKSSYSNSNFVLLGYIIEKITKQPYSSNLEKRICSVIGLKDTYIGKKTDLVNNESYSYKFGTVWEQQPETDLSIPGGAGSVVSTPTDLTRFVEALFSLKLVSLNSLNQMKTMKEGIGMGMFQFPFHEKSAYGHNGGIDGFVSNVAYFPEDSLAVSYCTNGMVYPLNDILVGILSICFNKKYSIPDFKTITLKTGELDKYLGVYSSTQIAIKITITKDHTTLIAQGDGQAPFHLEATEKDKFKFEPAGVKMEFNPANNELTLKQGIGTYLFTKVK